MREGRNQYAPMQGVPALRQAIAAKYPSPVRRRLRSRHRGDRDVRRHGRDLRRRRRRRASRRRGHRLRALLRLVRAGDRGQRRHGRRDLAALPRLRRAVGRGARRDHAAHADDHAQLAAQPGGRRSSAPDDIAELDAAGRGHRASRSSATKSTSTSSSTARATRAWRAYDALRARSFIVGSFGKTYHVTGWKVGYVVAPAALTTEFRKVHQFVTFSTMTPVQHALAEFLVREARLSGAVGVLPAQAGPVPGADRRLAVEAAALARHLLPAAGLLGDHRREGHGLRAAPDEGARRRVDPDVGVPLQAGGAAGAAVLFREEGRDTAGGGGAVEVVVAGAVSMRRAGLGLLLVVCAAVGAMRILPKWYLDRRPGQLRKGVGLLQAD